MSQTINAKALDYVETTGKALALAQKMAEEREAERVKVVEQAPKLAEALVGAKLIQEIEKAAAIEQLCDPVRSLAILGNLIKVAAGESAKAVKAAAAGGNGHAVPATNGKAPVLSTEDNYVGRRRGLGKTAESDRRLFEGLGLAPPSGS